MDQRRSNRVKVMTTLEHIDFIGGPQRKGTFCRVAKAAISAGAKNIVETGCYRGIDFDGQSTKVWALLAKETGGHVISIDLSPDSIEKAKALLGVEYDQYVTLVHADALDALKDITAPIDVLYLDSYDHDDSNPGPCQEHQLKEAEIAIPKMAEKSIILLDDAEFSDGGKVKLSAPFIEQSGFKCVERSYQNLYQRGYDHLF